VTAVRAGLQEVSQAFERRSRALVTLAVRRVADGRTRLHRRPRGAASCTLLQVRAPGAATSIAERRANLRGVAQVRTRVTAGAATLDVIHEAGLVRAADLGIAAFALMLAGGACVALIGPRVAAGRAAVRLIDEA